MHTSILDQGSDWGWAHQKVVRPWAQDHTSMCHTRILQEKDLSRSNMWDTKWLQLPAKYTPGDLPLILDAGVEPGLVVDKQGLINYLDPGKWLSLDLPPVLTLCSIDPLFSFCAKTRTFCSDHVVLESQENRHHRAPAAWPVSPEPHLHCLCQEALHSMPCPLPRTELQHRP